MSVLARLALVLTIALTGVVASVTPAQAGEKRYWHNRLEAPFSKGYSSGGLEVEFLSTRAVDIEGFIQDMCEKDGNSAYMYFRVITDHTAPSFPAQADSNGCGNGRKYFDPAPVRAPQKGNRLRGIHAYVCQIDYDSRQPFAYRCASEYFDNWRVD